MSLLYCRLVVRATINNQRGFLLRCQSSKADNDELPASFANEDDSTQVMDPPPVTNHSRLLPQHRNVLHRKVPYSEPQSWIHLTEKYNRKLFGRYGLESGVNPRICFPTKADIQEKIEYEKIKYPHTIQDMIKNVKLEKEAKRLEIQEREDHIAKKLEKLEQWKSDLNAKIAKKEAETRAAKERKERLVEEVRRHFGFTVDPRDERFKELLDKKEKEDRKQRKEEKRKAKEDKMMSKLVERNQKLVGGEDSSKSS